MQAPLAERFTVTLDTWYVAHKLGSSPERPFFTKV